ncbi:ATP-grasp domain-containing protein [Clostridium sp. 'deep sea']|uniref:D-alanine--D-alanine ligase family protein n=1 Tax=Clostridium sp. 'deep sea' TaxID=2779445 RepID=UPI0018963F19|nr:ATP-grasp domain-containing protein [Clostridium sp. 'deep sea']QOR36662.1 ATP-grasp domain-containing protein [Clostridium sp. 'deep sea']
MKIALVYTVEEKRQYRPHNQHGVTQLQGTNHNICQALRGKGHEVISLPADYSMMQKLQQIKPDCIFNNCTGIHDKSSQPQIAGMLELLNIPFTGSCQLVHNLALYKPLAKLIFQSQGLPTPKFQVIKHSGEELNNDLQYPLIVKPEHEGSSIGISNDSIVYNESDCITKANYIINNYQQPALVEEFVIGREFTVGVLGNENPQVLPFVEIAFKSKGGFYSHNVKSLDGVETICPTNVGESLKKNIASVVLNAYKTLGCCDYARIDIRLTKNEQPKIIEVNTLPGLQKGYSDFPKAALEAGICYEDMIERIVESCIIRFNKRRN